MPSVESSIDSLYQGPLASFVAARGVLARTLKGDDARRVKQLPKPTATAWAVNQVYWQSRTLYDRLMTSGKKLRSAQIDALNGRSVDLREAADGHRAAVSQAVTEASRFASQAGNHPNPDDLSRTFEALSLGVTPAGTPGRLSTSLQPLGFEALQGVVVRDLPEKSAPVPRHAPPPSGRSSDESSRQAAEEARARQREREEAAARRQKDAAIKKASAVLLRAREAEARARTEWERSKLACEAAERALAALQS
jgi:hypothetical protein